MQVFVWGFSPSELQHWPPDLQPIRVSTWPPESVVVVSDIAFESFQQAARANSLPDGQLPTAILYRTSEVPLTQDAWQYVDIQVEAGDWSTLRHLLSSPDLFDVTDQAHNIPIAWLRQFVGRLDTLTPDQVPVGADLQQRLKAHPAMWRAFVHNLRERMTMLLHLPPPDSDPDAQPPPSEG